MKVLLIDTCVICVHLNSGEVTLPFRLQSAQSPEGFPVV